MDVTPDDNQEGKIVTPLPPNKIHSSSGIVTPKLPIEIAREQAERNKEVHEEIVSGETTEQADIISTADDADL